MPFQAKGDRPFPLTWVFAGVSLLSIGVATLVVAQVIARQERRAFIARGEEYAREIAGHLNQEIAALLLDDASGRDLAAVVADPDLFRVLDDLVKGQIRHFRIESVLLFEPGGRVAYSTNPGYIGLVQRNEEILETLEGRVHSEFRPAQSRRDLDGVRIQTDLLETYHPLSAGPAGPDGKRPIVGVLEIYQDAAPIAGEIKKARRQVAWITVLTMGGLFCVLFFLVRRADRTIRRQTGEIRKANDLLERRVQERTAELASAQERLVEAAKLAAVGGVAAGVAHEINNPIASVAACAEGLLSRAETAPFREAPEFSDFRDYLTIIKREAYRCKEVTARLLDFARQRPARREAVPLADVLGDVSLLLSHHPAVREGRVRIDAGRHAAYGDPSEIKQIFLNLVKNALDAIQGVPDGRVEIQVRREGEDVVSVVRDNGSGFAPADAGRLFDPFFTTKEAGRGTGLGLALSRAIAERHNGRIAARSAGPGQGAEFELTLPAA